MDEMSKKPTKNKYTIHARLDVYTAIEVEADSLDDAVGMSHDLDTDNFITFIDLQNGHMDSTCEITGVHKVE